MDVAFDPGKHLISGTQQVTFRNTLEQPVDQVSFLVKANFQRKKNPYISELNLNQGYPQGFDPAWTKVKQVSSPGDREVSMEWSSLPPSLQTYSLNKTLLVVNLSTPLEPGENMRLSMAFSTKFALKKAGDEERFKETYTWRFGWNPLLTPASWWPPENLSERRGYELPAADYQVQVAMPPEWNLATGTGPTTVSTEDKTKKATYSLSNARSFSIFFSKKHRYYKENFEGLQVRVFHQPGYKNEARIMASQVAEVIRYYSKKYGDYQYDTITIGQSPVSGLFGLAANGLILFGNSFFTDKDLLLSTVIDRVTSYVISHEVAHQWFGVGTGVDFNAQNWISEAFAEYLSLNYFENQFGSEGGNLFKFQRSGLIRQMIESQVGYVNLRKHMFELNYLLAYRQGFDEAVIKPQDEVKYSNYSQTRLYKKGYLILRTLEFRIGTKNMKEFLRRTYSLYNDKIASVDDLHRLAERVTGRNLDDFFGEWLYSDGYLDYGIRKISTKKRGKEEYINELVVFKKGSLSSPVELRVTTSGDKEISKEIEVQSGSKAIQFVTKSPVVESTIDPESMVMDVNRINNHKPREIEVAVTKNALPLDAYLIKVGSAGITGSVPGKHRWFLGPRQAGGTVQLGRKGALSGMVNFLGKGEDWFDLEGTISASRYHWSHPETGSPAKYWERSGITSLQAGRTVDESNESYFYVNLHLERQETVTDNWSLAADALISPKGFLKGTIQASETISLFPGVSLSATSNLGLSNRDLPGLFKFDLNELKSYSLETKDDGKSADRTYPGNYKLLSRLQLDIPMARNMTYFLGSLGVISNATQSFWAQSGSTWDTLDGINLGNFKGEVGVDFSFQGRTLGGLLPFEVTLGYAYHGSGTGNQYLKIGLGL